MSVVIFLRHAETTANEQGLVSGRAYETDLTVKGIKQAQLAAEKLLPHRDSISFIISSGLTRTNHTANIVNQHLNKKIIYDLRLQERYHGEYEGVHYSIVIEAIGKVRDNQCPYYGGESKEEFRTRIVTSMCEYFQRDEEMLLVVSHGYTGMVLIESFYGEDRHVGNAEPIIFDPLQIPDLFGICSQYIDQN